MRGRPSLYTNYSKESAIFSNNTQKVWFAVVLLFAISLCFLASEYWILLLTTAFLYSVACWGLNIVSGFAGQINLAHGFFVGIGTYTSAIVGGIASTSVIGYELDMVIWLPLSGMIASLVGLIIAPITVRLKGLNLGLVTLALVFIGSHVFSNFRQRALRDNVYRGFHLATLDTTLVEAELVHKGSEPLVYLCSTHDELAESERFRCSH